MGSTYQPITRPSPHILADGVPFTGEAKLVQKATGHEQDKAEAALSHIAFAGCANRTSGVYWSVSVTHRFLGRGKVFNPANDRHFTSLGGGGALNMNFEMAKGPSPDWQFFRG